VSPPDDVDPQMAEAARQLYAGTPEEFTAERDRMAREAKDAGDRGLARALQSLKRPVVAAWAVNLLVREEAELLGQVLDIGDALREAQAGLEGDALRELGRQRRQLIDSVVGRARALVAEHGSRLTSQAEQQVAATLQAALADPAAARAVLTGCLVKPLESTGLGTVDLRDHVAAPRPSGSASTAPRRPKVGKAGSDEAQRQAQLREQAEERRRLKRAAAQDRLTDAEQVLEDAERSRDDVRRRHEEARAHVLHLEARIDELRRQISDLESQAETACEVTEAREQDVADADVEVDEARAELQAAQAALAELE
jgi:DNA repair exonuclease SbcCD ATPase subunit